MTQGLYQCVLITPFTWVLVRQQTLLSSESRGIKDLVKGLKQKSDEEQLREVGMFSLGKEAQGEHYHPPQHLKGGCRQVGSVSSPK